MHEGIDIGAPQGSPVLAVATGTVEFAGWTEGGYGNLIEIRHADGSLTRYAHLSRILIQVGAAVTQGQAIGEVGSTGRSTGPHLHFELRLAGKGAVDPLGYLPGL
jgi:murein DD-endopeptidase MepM/ murein hydrolase activator NlpD